jgi:multisubunit Na+/H+ antiporter MnhC subunit
MDLLLVLFVIALIGCGVYLITTYIPMPPIFHTAILLIAVVFVLLYLFRTFGGSLPNVMH